MREHGGGAEVIDTGITAKLNAGEVVVDAEPDRLPGDSLTRGSWTVMLICR